MVRGSTALVLLSVGLVISTTTFVGALQVIAHINGSDVETGVIAGKVSIGPFCPVEPVKGCLVPPGTYSSRLLVLTSGGGKVVNVPLAPDGTFQATVPSSTYSVTLSNCSFLGCTYSWPRTVVVPEGNTTNLDIFIDTGIR
jgi:hypothetical protein